MRLLAVVLLMSAGVLSPLDGTLTVTLSGSGGRTGTALTLQSTGPGTWDTDGGSAYWTLGVAATLAGILLNNPITAAGNLAGGGGGTVIAFPSRHPGGEVRAGGT